MTDTKTKPRHRNAEGASLFEYIGTETRSTSGTFAVEPGKDDDHAIVRGSAIRYSPVVSKIRDALGEFGEEVKPGALTGADTSDVRFLVNHDGVPLARYCPSKNIRTLELDDRSDGLYYKATIDLRSQSANDLAIALENKSIDQCSYGFSMVGGQQQWRNGDTHRTILRYGSLSDISVVTYPAEPSTSAGISERSVEREMRFVHQVMTEHRSGKKISAATKSKLTMAIGHLTAAGVNLDASHQHLADLLTLPQGGTLQDGTSSGGNGAGSGWNSPGAMSGDAAGSRSGGADSPEFRKLLRKLRKQRTAEILRSVEREKHEHEYSNFV